MSAPTWREYPQNAAAPVRRQNPNLLRRHWLSAACIFGLAGLTVYMGMLFYRTEQKLRQVRASRAQLEAKLDEARNTSQRLQNQVSKAADDGHMELMAKAMGFVYPRETVYQTNSAH